MAIKTGTISKERDRETPSAFQHLHHPSHLVEKTSIMFRIFRPTKVVGTLGIGAKGFFFLIKQQRKKWIVYVDTLFVRR